MNARYWNSHMSSTEMGTILKKPSITLQLEKTTDEIEKCSLSPPHITYRRRLAIVNMAAKHISLALQLIRYGMNGIVPYQLFSISFGNVSKWTCSAADRAGHFHALFTNSLPEARVTQAIWQWLLCWSGLFWSNKGHSAMPNGYLELTGLKVLWIL